MQEQPPILHREDRVHRERDWGIEYYNNISIYVISNAIRTPFQGDFLVRVDPRAEAWLKPWAVFYAPFGRLEHTREKVQTTGTGDLARQLPKNNFTIGFALVLVVVLAFTICAGLNGSPERVGRRNFPIFERPGPSKSWPAKTQQ